MMPYKLFKNLQGNWRFHRTLQNSSSSESLGFVDGTASFIVIKADRLHYQEVGVLTDSCQKKLKIHQEYLYIFDETKDTIEKKFSENGQDKGFFYFLSFDASSEQNNEVLFYAYGDHLCNRDHYKALYEFKKTDNRMNKFALEYVVKGPDKDYVSKTFFRRQVNP